MSLWAIESRSGYSWAVDSRQIEARCRYAPSPKMPGDKPTRISAVTQPATPQGPSLNYDDVPEVGFGGRPKFAARTDRTRGPQARAKASVKKMTHFEAVVEVEEEEWSDGKESTREPSEDAAWPCAVCTYLNPGSALECELCSHPASAFSEARDDAQAAPAAVPVGRKAWPSLMQAVNPAWDACDASSVTAGDLGKLTEAHVADLSSLPATAEQFDIASQACDDASVAGSWLQLSDTKVEEFEIGSEPVNDDASVAASWLCAERAEVASTASWFDVALIADVEPTQASTKSSWASLAATSAPVAKPPRHGVRVPPLTTTRKPKKAAKTDDDDDLPDDHDRRNRCGSRAHRRGR